MKLVIFACLFSQVALAQEVLNTNQRKYPGGRDDCDLTVQELKPLKSKKTDALTLALDEEGGQAADGATPAPTTENQEE